jgi:hypothetical protein
MPVILTTWEMEIRRMVVQGQTGQKISEIPISTNKPGMWCVPVVPDTCEAIDRWIIVQASQWKNVKLYQKKKNKKNPPKKPKGWDHGRTFA